MLGAGLEAGIKINMIPVLMELTCQCKRKTFKNYKKIIIIVMSAKERYKML